MSGPATRPRRVAPLVYAGLLLSAVIGASRPTVAQPIELTTLLQQGWEAQQAGRHPEAEQAYRAALQLNPSSVDGRLGLTLPLMALGRWAEVEEVTASLLRDDPGHRIARLRHALARYQQGGVVEALALYQRLIEDDPGDAEAWQGVGWCELRAGRLEQAEAACRQAQDLQPAAPGPAECLAACVAARAPVVAPPSWYFGLDAYGGALAYSHGAGSFLNLLGMLTARAPWGLQLIVDGATTTRSHRSIETESIGNLGLGLGWLRPGGWISGHLLLGRTSGETIASEVYSSDTTAVELQGGLNRGAWSFRLEGAVALAQAARTTTVAQLEPELSWRLGPRWTLGVHTRWLGNWTPGPQQGRSQARLFQGRNEQLLSAGGFVRWVVHPRAALRLSGWGGERRFGIESNGLVFPATVEHWIAGGRLDAGLDVTRWLALWLAVQAALGDEEEAEAPTSGQLAQPVDPFVLFGVVGGILIHY